MPAAHELRVCTDFWPIPEIRHAARAGYPQQTKGATGSDFWAAPCSDPAGINRDPPLFPRWPLICSRAVGTQDYRDRAPNQPNRMPTNATLVPAAPVAAREPRASRSGSVVHGGRQADGLGTWARGPRGRRQNGAGPWRYFISTKKRTCDTAREQGTWGAGPRECREGSTAGSAALLARRDARSLFICDL